jgi:hypothetical protein
MGAGTHAEPVAQVQYARAGWLRAGQPGWTHSQQRLGTWQRRARVAQAEGQRAPRCDPGPDRAQNHLPRSTARPIG